MITASKLADRKFQVTATSVQGFATEKAGIVGKQARRRLAAGKPIPLASLEDHVAVRRGMSLIARYAGDGFSISSRLIALEDGIEGNIISARNGATGVIVQALVRGDGTLLVTGE